MIKIENVETFGWEAAIRGMRNPKNSWDKSDSRHNQYCDDISCSDCPYHDNSNCEQLNVCSTNIGSNDHDLMMRLSKAGTDHRKFMRMIAVYVDITAPLYW